MTGQVVGTYRLLPPERAAVAGRLYSEGEFDLARSTRSAPASSRSAAPASTPTTATARSSASSGPGIARYMVDRGHDWLAGCCSIPLADGGALAAATWDRVQAKHLAPEEYRVRPLLPWYADGVARPAGRTELPPLLRGYLRLGAWVCGEPAHDPDFGVADLYVLLSMRRINPRYLRHFLSLVPA